MRAKALFEGIPELVHKTGELPLLEVENIVTSAETVSKNSVFVCTRTAIRDGHYSARDAYCRGCRLFVARRGLALPEDACVFETEDTETALARLSARFWGPLPRHMQVFGVTGTHGKSAVVLTAIALLRQSGRKAAALTGDGEDDGCDFMPAGEIVADSADVWRFLHRCGTNGVKCVFLELSAYMLRHGTGREIPFAGVLLTDLAPHHIGAGMHRDFAAYSAAKRSLFAPPAKRAYLPTELSASFEIKIPTTYYGEGGFLSVTDEGAAVQGERPGRGLLLRGGGLAYTAFYPVPGSFAARNAEAAAVLAQAAGLSLTEIAEGLLAAMPTGRLELLATRDGRRIYLDTAYTGEELLRVLHILREITPGRLTVVLGSVGGRARERRAAFGAASGRLADFTFFTTDDPASEPPLDILSDLTADWPRLARYDFIEDRAVAIQTAVAELHAGDTLLILGKAQNETQFYADGHAYFSDREIADAALYFPQ